MAEAPSPSSRPDGGISEPAIRDDGADLCEAAVRLKRCRRRSGLAVFLGKLLVMFVLLTATLAGGLYWRLGQGPLAAGIFTARIHDMIAQRLPPDLTLELGGVAFERRNGRFGVMLQQVVLRGQDGEALVAAPRMDVGLGAGDLLVGRTALESVSIEGAVLTVVFGADGRMRLQAGGTAGPTATETSQAIEAALQATAALETVDLRDATLVVRDEALGRDTRYEGIDCRLRRTAAPGGLALTLGVGGGTVNATLEGLADGARAIDVQAQDIDLRNVVHVLSPGSAPPRVQARLGVLARGKLSADGRIEAARVEISAPGGSWEVEPELPPFRFDAAALRLEWDPRNGSVLVQEASLQAGDGRGTFSGVVHLPADGPLGLWRFDLKAPEVLVASHVEGEPQLKLDTALLSGRYDPKIRRIGIDRGEFSGPTAGFTVAGSFTFGGKTPGIGLGVTGRRMPLAAMKRLWPFFSIPKARAWFLDHVEGGMLEAGELTIAIDNDLLVPVDGDIPPLPDEAVKGRMIFSDASVRLSPELPAIVRAEAVAEFSGRKFLLAASSAAVETGDSGPLAFSDVEYRLGDPTEEPRLQAAKFRLRGPTAAVGTLLVKPPLSRAANGLAIDPTTVSGTADLRVEVGMPLVPHPKPEEVRFAVNGSLDDMGIADFEGARVEHGAMKIALEPGLVLMTGKAVYGGMPAQIDLRKADGAEPQIALGLTLDDAARRKKGLDFGEALDGPVRVELRPLGKSAEKRYSVDVDLAAARIRDLLPGWQKAPGKAARASFTVDVGSNGVKIQDLNLDAGPIGLRGEISLTADHKLRRASMSALRFSEGDDATASFEPMTGGWKATVRARKLDLKPILGMLQKRGGASAGTGGGSLVLDMKIEEADGFHGETLKGLALGLETRGMTIRRLDLQGSFPTGALSAKLASGAGGRPYISIQSPDAGAVMRFLNYYSRLRGGDLIANLTPAIDNMAGQLIMRNFSVVDEPALGRYRSSLQESPSARDLPAPPQNGNSARFTKLRLGFTRTADRIGIAEAVVWGQDVGVSLAGEIDYGGDKVNLVGTFVPAYALNNLFTQIPLVGDLLGGQYGGLFAITFKVSGRLGAPVLTVNPLSAIAPGFLRKIFEFQKE